MQHYFIDKPHKETDFFEFKDSVLGYELCFRSCDSIFSKTKIDDGTRALLNAIDKHFVLSGTGLDVGCGLGVIGIALIKRFNVNMHMLDVNNTAVSLTQQNIVKNNVKPQASAFLSNGFANVKDYYDFIVSNPPIKTGKKLLFSLMDGAMQHLKPNAPLIVVIRKDHGMQSLKNYLTSLFNNCEIVARDKGYYILKAIKN